MSNLYIRVKTGFFTHRKTVRLKLKIGFDAFWVVPRLWAFAAENQPDGNLSNYSPEEIAELIGYPTDATSNACALLQALLDSGFIDSDMALHDWQEHNGYHEKFSQRAKDAANARWEKERGKRKRKGKEEIEKEIGDKQCSSNATSMYSADCRVALHWLNEKSCRRFRETESSLSVIQARLKEPGVDIEGVKAMIDRQCERWKGTTMEEYLRPETLFGKTKFDGYYAARNLPIQTAAENGKPQPKSLMLKMIEAI